MNNDKQPLARALLNSLHKYRQQLHGKRIWLACSGGRDSMSLAMLCQQLFATGQLPFLPQLLHVNHGMQEANTAWSQQVLAWSKQVGMPCRVLTLNLKSKSEQSARHARYDAMMQVMNCDDVLLLGHHQDDQVETVLMRLFNGAGVTGLGGMHEWTAKQCLIDSLRWDIDINNIESSSLQNDCLVSRPSKVEKTIYLWRPWLSISRAQISEYAKASGLNYIDDPTNIIDFSRDTVFIHEDHSKTEIRQNDVHEFANDRAWLRSVLMPVIKQRYPQAVDAIFRSSELMQDASSIIGERTILDLENVAETHLAKTQLSTAKQVYLYSVIDITKLQTSSPARQSALIYQWLSPDSGDLPPSKRLVDEVLALCQRDDNNHQTCLNWHSGHNNYEIRRYQNKLYHLTQDWVSFLNGEQNSEVSSQCISLAHKEHQSIDNVILRHCSTGLHWQLLGVDKLVNQFSSQDKHLTNKDNACLVFEPLPRDLKVRLFGRKGRKSGKKLLQAINQPAFMRQSVLLCSVVYGDKTLPLFIITVDAIFVLDSIFAEQINALQQQKNLYPQINVNSGNLE